MDAAALRQYVARRGSVVSIKELSTLIDRQQLAAALRDQHLVRLNRTKLALPDVDQARQEAVRLDGMVSHLSAAMAHGWKVKRPPDNPMVTVPSGRKIRLETPARIFYSRIRVTRPGGLTSPVDTVVDCARSLPFDEALSVADSALRSRKVTREELLEAAECSPRTGRARALRVAKTADGDAANPFESVLRAIALEVPGFDVMAQCPVPGVGHPDVGDPTLRIALEADSFSFHAEKEAFSYDIRRYTDMVRRGWLVARFTWDDVMHRPDYVREVITDLVALRATQRGHHPLKTATLGGRKS